MEALGQPRDGRPVIIVRVEDHFRGVEPRDLEVRLHLLLDADGVQVARENARCVCVERADLVAQDRAGGQRGQRAAPPIGDVAAVVITVLTVRQRNYLRRRVACDARIALGVVGAAHRVVEERLLNLILVACL